MSSYSQQQQQHQYDCLRTPQQGDDTTATKSRRNLAVYTDNFLSPLWQHYIPTPTSAAFSPITISPSPSTMSPWENEDKAHWSLYAHTPTSTRCCPGSAAAAAAAAGGSRGGGRRPARRPGTLRIERRFVPAEYGSRDENFEKGAKSEWLAKSDRFQAPSPATPKWFTDSWTSGSGSWVDRKVGVKVCILGDAAVGKTSFTSRYVSKVFSKTYQWTVGVDFALKVVKWSDNTSIKLQLWDIAGQERFASMTRVYYKDTHACIIIFDLTQRRTFQNALKWKQDLDSKCRLSDGSPIPCILLANKCDLDHREVEQCEIEKFCKEQNFIGWTETSVLQGLMIDESMNFLLAELMKSRGAWEHPLCMRAADNHIQLHRPCTKDTKKCC